MRQTGRPSLSERLQTQKINSSFPSILMMPSGRDLDMNARRSFHRRRLGLFKKAYELHQRFRADIGVALIVRIGDQYYVYRSSQSSNWPPSMQDIVSRVETLPFTHVTNAPNSRGDIVQ